MLIFFFNTKNQYPNKSLSYDLSVLFSPSPKKKKIEKKKKKNIKKKKKKRTLKNYMRELYTNSKPY